MGYNNKRRTIIRRPHMNNEYMKSHLELHPDQYDDKIISLMSYIGDSLEAAFKANAGIQIVIRPEDTKILYNAFKAKGLL